MKKYNLFPQMNYMDFNIIQLIKEWFMVVINSI